MRLTRSDFLSVISVFEFDKKKYKFVCLRSPNGDSSSTQSRQSVMRSQAAKGSDLLTRTLKSRGHSRELSEISVGSDETNLEIETLLKRIQEMTEILEARESKLIDVSRMNMELQEQNSNFKKYGSCECARARVFSLVQASFLLIIFIAISIDS